MHPLLQTLKSQLGRIAREAALYPRFLGSGASRRGMFFPSFGREQSGLLRAYNVSDRLNAAGWRSVVVPMHLQQGQRTRLLRVFRPDVVVLQMCRHRLNRIEHFPGQRVVLDIDDADFFDPALTEAMEATAREARGVICGSGFLRDWAQRFNANATVVWTGTPVSPGPWNPHSDRKRIVTWAQSDPLGYPEEFAFVTRLLVGARREIGPFTLRLYGWYASEDHPSLAPFRKAGVELELIGRLRYAEFVASLREVAVGLSPIVAQSAFSRGKSFGKILGYLDAKVPVICSDEADHAAFFTADTGVVSNDPAVWTTALNTLLADPSRRQAMADAAHADFRRQLSSDVAAEKVGRFLAGIVSASRNF